MPAYKRDIRQRCLWSGCELRANYEAFNHLNASMGFYCQRHIDLAVKRLNAPEPDLTRRQQPR